MTNDISDPTHFELHLSAKNSPQTAIDLLAENCSLSKQKIKAAMTNGAAWLESSIGIHRLRRAKKILTENDTLHFYYDETIQHSKPIAATLIADENEYSIWNKPYGMYSQGSKWGDHCTINRWAEEHLIPQRPAFIVHRLDRAANGLILIAHSKKMAIKFSELFRNRNIEKRYSAIVKGSLNKLALPYTIANKIDDKPAISNIISIENNPDKITESTTSKILIEIETGRKHQIRKHLAELGFPIVGDRLYGTAESTDDLQLQAKTLKFICPVTHKQKTYSL